LPLQDIAHSVAEHMDPRSSVQRHRGTAAVAHGLVLLLLTSCGGQSPTASSSATPSEPGSIPSSELTASVVPSPSSTSTEVEDGITGTWSGTWTIDPPYGNSGGWTMELVQTGDTFNGTVELTETDCSDGTVSGTVDGTQISFGWIVTPQPIQFEGVVNDTQMTGTWSSLACSDPDIELTGTWVGTKEED
jgi:hypothetical protein